VCHFTATVGCVTLLLELGVSKECHFTAIAESVKVSSMNYCSVRMNVLVMLAISHRFASFLYFLALEELSRFPGVSLIL